MLMSYYPRVPFNHLLVALVFILMCMWCLSRQMLNLKQFNCYLHIPSFKIATNKATITAITAFNVLPAQRHFYTDKDYRLQSVR